MKKQKKKGKKKMKKLWKVLIPVLVLALVFACLFVFGSSAADDAVTVPEGTVVEGGETVVAERWKNGARVASYKSLWEAYNASSGKGTDTVKVVCDFVAKNALPLSNWRDVTIDLCGHTIYIDGSVTYNSKGTDTAMQFVNLAFNTKVNCVFTSSVGRGKIVSTANATHEIFNCYTSNVDNPNSVDISNIDIVSASTPNIFATVRHGAIKLTNVKIDATKKTANKVFSIDTFGNEAFSVALDFDGVDITTANISALSVTMTSGTFTGTIKNSNFTTTTSSTYAIELPNVVTDVRFEGCTVSHTSTTWGFAVNTTNTKAGSTCTFDKCVFTSNQALFRNVNKDASHNNTIKFNDCEFTTGNYAIVLNGSKAEFTGSGTRINPTGNFIWDNTQDSPVTFGYGIRFSKNTKLSNGCAALTAIEPALVKDGLLPDTFPYVYTVNVEVKFNYPDGTSSTVPTAIGSAPVATSALDFNAVAVAKAFTAKKMDLAGWATTEGATEALATLPAVTEEQVGTTVNYYPVLKSIDPSVDYIVISGENGKYGTAATWGDMIKGTDVTITLLRDTVITTTVDNPAVDLTGSKVKLDLNGKSLTSTTSVPGTTFMFMLRGNSSLAVWSSVPGATLSLGKSNPLVQANWAVGDFVIGASSVAEVNGENPYSGNMSINAVSSVVTFNNARGNLCLDGVTVKTDNILFDVGFKRTEAGAAATVIVKNSDITSGSCVWQYGGAAGQPVNARFINSTVSAKTAFFTTTTTAGHKLNIEFNNCYLSGKISDKNGAYSNATNVEGTLKLTGDTYVNGTVAREATFEDGKALRPVVKTVKGVTYTKKVAGANEIIGVKFNLTLYSSFNLNLYVLSEYGLGGNTVEIDGHTYTKHEYSFAANKIADAQSIKLGSYDAISVSVLDYAKALFALDDSALMSNEKKLMADALVYANAAAKLIGGSENANITALLTANDTYKSTLKTFNGVAKDMTSVSDGFVSASLDLTSQPRFIFTIKSGVSVSVSYTNFWNVTVTKTETDAVGGQIVIDDMRIFDFANQFTLTVGEKSTTYSLADYAANTDVQELCNALYTYILTAKAFKAANPNV